jgi:hypothetical protein
MVWYCEKLLNDDDVDDCPAAQVTFFCVVISSVLSLLGSSFVIYTYQKFDEIRSTDGVHACYVMISNRSTSCRLILLLVFFSFFLSSANRYIAYLAWSSWMFGLSCLLPTVLGGIIFSLFLNVVWVLIYAS